jgi:hypothetical protein
VAGTIAVAVAAAMAWQLRDAPQTDFAQKFFAEILRLTPESKVRRGILLASQTPIEIPFKDSAKSLGNGSLVTAPDTVPFCIWMAANYPRYISWRRLAKPSAWVATATQMRPSSAELSH